MASRRPVLAALLFASSLLPVSSAFAIQPRPAPAAKAAADSGAPVTVQGKPIFYVRKRVLSFSPEDRARAIEAKIEKLAKGPEADIQAITTADSETSTAIVSGELVIMTITDDDASTAGLPRAQMAADFAGSIRDAAEELHRQSSLKAILLGSLWTVLSTIGFLALLWVMRMVFPRIYARILAWHGKVIRGVRIQELELLPAERITNLLLLLARIVRFVLVFTLLYFYVSLVFSFFAWLADMPPSSSATSSSRCAPLLPPSPNPFPTFSSSP